MDNTENNTDQEQNVYYEYIATKVIEKSSVTELLNAYGKKNWRLVYFDGDSTFIFEKTIRTSKDIQSNRIIKTMTEI